MSRPTPHQFSSTPAATADFATADGNLYQGPCILKLSCALLEDPLQAAPGRPRPARAARVGALSRLN